MTEIEIRNQEQAVSLAPVDTAMDRLGRWLQQADAVFAIAQRVCSTSFAPSAYRGKPDEAAAAMLAGAELGLDPMASLRAFDSINGVPAPKAVTLRAIALGAGHEIETVEQSPTRAVVRGRRFGKGDWQTSTWDIDRARKLPQFKSNANYTNNLEAMLVARATAEVCRWVASDALMGMPYAAEEIGDQPALAPSPLARKVTLADLDEPQNPGADEPAADEQHDKMAELWAALGFSGDENHEQRLDITRRILRLPELDASAEYLTQAQADTVIAALRERLAQTAGAE